MSLDTVIAIYIMPMAKSLMISSSAKSSSLASSSMCLDAVKVIILYNTKSPVRLKTSLIILGNPFAD